MNTHKWPKKTLKEQERNEVLRYNADELSKLLSKGDHKKIKVKWESFDAPTMIGVFEKLGYENQVLLWGDMSIIEHAGLWKHADSQGQFFDQLSHEDKKDIWFLATNDLDKISLFVYLGYSGSEGSQVDLLQISL
jgi:hypothetical protein